MSPPAGGLLIPLGSACAAGPARVGQAVLAVRTIDQGGIARTYRVYVPESPREQPAVVFVFHGSRGDGAQIRRGLGYGPSPTLLWEGLGPMNRDADGVRIIWEFFERAGLSGSAPRD